MSWCGQKKNVQEQLNKCHADRIAGNRRKRRSMVETVILCGRQNFPLRGNDEGRGEDCSNFRALLNFRISAGDKVLEEHLVTADKNAIYTTNTVQNELIDVTADYMREQTITRVKKSPFFSITADEVTDASSKEQLAVVLRYVDSDRIAQERLIDFVECAEGITGETLAKSLLEKVTSYGLDPNLIRGGRGYDGAGNMSGKAKVAAAVIQRDYPEALYFHCASHQLNVCVVKSTDSTYVPNMMGTMEKVGYFFDNHPKTHICTRRWSRRGCS